MGRHGLCGHRSGAATEICNVGRFGIRELLGQRLGSLAPPVHVERIYGRLDMGVSCLGN
jgi:hypothetical protein